MPAPPDRASTCADHRLREARIATELRRAYVPSLDGSVVEVRFGCDPLTEPIARVVLEHGSGHSGGLTLWRLTPSDDDPSSFAAHGFALRSSGQSQGTGGALVIAHALVPRAALMTALADALPAMTAEFRELAPPPLPRGVRGSRASVSSADFDVFIGVTDSVGRVLARSFAGYPGSSDQDRYLGVQLAASRLRPLLENARFERARPTDEERAFFVGHYLAALPRLHAEYAWWVRERFVLLAAELGTPALVPALLDDVKLELGEREQGGDAAPIADRRLDGLVTALAALTGWDARRDERGAARPVDEVARDYLGECERALAE